MNPSDLPFNLEGLSPRESQILELASQGRTDEQIAQGMGISTSTVNSYWVRIRGKVGQFSRTELVGKVLRREMLETGRELRDENLRLQQELLEAQTRLAELRATLHALRSHGAEFLPALAHSPQPTIVTGPPATVLYANEEACRLYAVESNGLDGLPMRELCTDATPESLREPCRVLFEDDGPEREIIGIEEPYYARRRDGSGFRAVVRTVRYESPSGPLAVVTIDPFERSAELVISALRSTLAA